MCQESSPTLKKMKMKMVKKDTDQDEDEDDDENTERQKHCQNRCHGEKKLKHKP